VLLPGERLAASAAQVRLVPRVPLLVPLQPAGVGEHVEANAAGVQAAAQVALSVPGQLVVAVEGFSTNLS